MGCGESTDAAEAPNAGGAKKPAVASPAGKSPAAAGGGAKQLPFPKVQQTWKMALANAEKKGSNFGAFFYDNLFINTPRVKETFFGKTQHAEQRMNLTRSISLVLGMLDQMESAVAALEALGARHVLYIGPAGPDTEGTYKLVGAMLVKTLTDLCGEEVIADAAPEWLTLYGVIMEKMIGAMKDDAKSLPWVKKFVTRRVGELKSITTKWAAPNAFSETEYAKGLVSYARGQTPADGDKIVAALANLFGKAQAETATAQQFTPFIQAATDVAKAVKAAEGAKSADVLQKILAGVPQVLEKENNPLSHYDLMVLADFTDAMKKGFAKA